MSIPHTLLLLLAAFAAVFAQAAFPLGRMLFGAQIDLLPSLVVYAALSGGVSAMCLVSIWGGLLFDSLSANPLGTSLPPLLLAGTVILLNRELILRDQTFAQAVLGVCSNAVFGVFSLLILLHLGTRPTLGWGTVWELLVTALGGGVLSPLTFQLFGWLERHLTHGVVVQTSFRNDREIRRGRG